LSFRCLFPVLLLAAAAILLPSAGRAAGTSLIGTVGPGFTISLTDSSGNPVSHVNPGTYTILVHDKADIHNFHLFGPGVDQATDVTFTGDVTWTVTFGNGRYQYHCDVHPTQMHKSFISGVIPTVPKLNASVGPGRTISLKTAAGAKVKTLPAGTYKVVVKDRTRKDNFHLLGKSLSRKTGIRFRGTVSWTVSLAVGTYHFRSDAHRRLGGTFVVLKKPLPAG
jgi:hypothetical protein